MAEFSLTLWCRTDHPLSKFFGLASFPTYLLAAYQLRLIISQLSQLRLEITTITSCSPILPLNVLPKYFHVEISGSSGIKYLRWLGVNKFFKLFSQL
jgi:hypothetical protein